MIFILRTLLLVLFLHGLTNLRAFGEEIDVGPQIIVPKRIYVGETVFLYHLDIASEITINWLGIAKNRDPGDLVGDVVFDQKTQFLTKFVLPPTTPTGKYWLKYRYGRSGVFKDITVQVLVLNEVSVVLQTDKPLYRPGDSVRLRALSFRTGTKSFLLPDVDSAGPSAKVVIAVLELSNPDKIKIGRLFEKVDMGVAEWILPLDLTAPSGQYSIEVKVYEMNRTMAADVLTRVGSVEASKLVASMNEDISTVADAVDAILESPLVDAAVTDSLLGSPDFNLADWTLVQTTGTEFTVKPYRLPKYEINLDFSHGYLVKTPGDFYSYWDIYGGRSSSIAQSKTPPLESKRTEDFNLKISAKYTYGEPVFGQIIVKVFRLHSEWVWRDGSNQKEIQSFLLAEIKKIAAASDPRANPDASQPEHGSTTPPSLDLTNVRVDLSSIMPEFEKEYPGHNDRVRVQVEVLDMALDMRETQSRDFEVYDTDYMFTLETHNAEYVAPEEEAGSSSKDVQVDNELLGNAPAGYTTVSYFSPGLPSFVTVVLRKPDGTVMRDRAADTPVDLIVAFELEGGQPDLYSISPDFPEGTQSSWTTNVPECGDLKASPWDPYTLSRRGCRVQVVVNSGTGRSTHPLRIAIPNDAVTNHNCCNLKDFEFEQRGWKERSRSCCLVSVRVSLAVPYSQKWQSRDDIGAHLSTLQDQVCMSRRFSTTQGLHMETKISGQPTDIPGITVISMRAESDSIPRIQIQGASTFHPSDVLHWKMFIVSRGGLLAVETLMAPLRGKVVDEGGHYTWVWDNVALARTIKSSSSTYENLALEIGPEAEIIIQAKITLATLASPYSSSIHRFRTAKLEMPNSLKLSSSETERKPGEIVALHLDVMPGLAGGGPGQSIDELAPYLAHTIYPAGVVGPHAGLAQQTLFKNMQIVDTYLLGIDKSVTLLGGKRATISLDAIEQNLVAAFKARSMSANGVELPDIAEPWWRECTAHGDTSLYDAPSPGTLVSNPFLNQDAFTIIAPSNDRDDEAKTDPARDIPPCPRKLYGHQACSSEGGFGPEIMMEDADGGPSPRFNVAMAAGKASGVDDQAPVSKSTASSRPKVRTFFPETWIWDRIRTVRDGDGGLTSRVVSSGGEGDMIGKLLRGEEIRDGQIPKTDVVGDGFRVTVPKTCPDTITTFQIHGFSTLHATGANGGRAASGGFAIADSHADVKVFKPVFIDVRMPVAAIRGERVELVLTVFNYFDGMDTAEFELTILLEDGLRAATLEQDGSTQDVLANQGFHRSTTHIPEDAVNPLLPVGALVTQYQKVIRVEKGSYDKTIVACTAEKLGIALGRGIFGLGIGTQVMAHGSSPSHLSDAMLRYVNVQPEGVPSTESSSLVLQSSDLNLKNGDTSRMLRTLQGRIMVNQAHVVVDSLSISFLVTADVLGPDILGNLESLLQVPYGCGEQNMLTLTPNVAVALAYKGKSGALKKAVRKTLMRNMMTGVQRELQYRHPDSGGFSAFGSRGGTKDASLWLTAFVLRVFSDISEFMYVDDVVMKNAALFVTSQQKDAGHFQNIGELFHDEMMGGATQTQGNNHPPALTAYCLLALDRYLHKYVANRMRADDDYSTALTLISKSIARGVSYLREVADDAKSRYDWMLHIKVESNYLKHPSIQRTSVSAWTEDFILEKLVGLKETYTPSDSSAGTWDFYPYKAGPTIQPVTIRKYCYHGCDPTKAIDIEMSAYALLVLTEFSRISSGLQVVKYLGSKRRDGGGFVATQDTIVGLDSLSGYARMLDGQGRSTAGLYDGVAIELLTPARTGVPEQRVLASVTMTRTNSDLLQTVTLSQTEIPRELVDDLMLHGQLEFPLRFRWDPAQADEVPPLFFLGLNVVYNVATNTQPDVPSSYSLVTAWAIREKPEDNANERRRLHAAVGHSLKAAPKARMGINPEEMWADSAAHRRLSGSDNSDMVQVCVSPRGSGTESMILVTITLFSGFRWNLLHENACPSGISRCEEGSSDLLLYLSGIRSTTCFNVPVVETDRVGDRKPITSHVVEYYNPQAAGSSVAVWNGINQGKEQQTTLLRKVSQKISFCGIDVCGNGGSGDSCADNLQESLLNSASAKKVLSDGFERAYDLEKFALSLKNIAVKFVSGDASAMHFGVDVDFEVDVKDAVGDADFTSRLSAAPDDQASLILRDSLQVAGDAAGAPISTQLQALNQDCSFANKASVGDLVIQTQTVKIPEKDASGSGDNSMLHFLLVVLRFLVARWMQIA